MIDFRLIGTARGVPVYFQHLPGVNQVSLRWVVFVGSADDDTAGGHGIMHWFEHLPYHGTKHYPRGDKDIRGPIQRYGGKIQATTSQMRTEYGIFVPRDRFSHAFGIVTDMVANPLLTNEGIEIERRVIFNEIAERNSDLGDLAARSVTEKLFLGTPVSHSILGTRDSLTQVHLETLREAHASMYDASRCVLVVSGDLELDQLWKQVESQVSILPRRGLSERRRAVSLPDLRMDTPPGEVRTEVGMKGSAVAICWPIEPMTEENAWTHIYRLRRKIGALTCGSVAAPLLRKLRHEKQLVYSATANFSIFGLGGGYFSLVAQTESKANIPQVVQTMLEVLQDKECHSSARHEYVNDNIIGSRAMELINPVEYTRTLLSYLMVGAKHLPGQEEFYSGLLSVPHRQVVEDLKSLSPEKARIFTFLGTN